MCPLSDLFFFKACPKLVTLSGWYFYVAAVKAHLPHKRGGWWRDGCLGANVIYPPKLDAAAAKLFLPGVSFSSSTRAVPQQATTLLRHKMYHILDSKSLVSTVARGDSEDKCSFPEWFIMLRLHYLAFRGWQKMNPAPQHLCFNPKVNDIPELLFRRQSIVQIGNN